MIKRTIFISIAFIAILISSSGSGGNGRCLAQKSKKLSINNVKTYEQFCRLYPLHRNCMGAFASGGKRSKQYYNEAEEEEIDANELKKLLR